MSGIIHNKLARAYALKNIREDSRGHYWLHSWNKTYDDAPVDPETMVPIARLIGRVGETR
jgi:hypothetical protein